MTGHPVPGPGATWRSWHLHAASLAPAHLDTVVTEALGPLADRIGLLDQDGPPWFYLRYWQRGPHVRLRIAGLTGAEADDVESELADRLRTIDAGVPPEQRLDQDTYARAVRPLATAGESGSPLDVGELLPPGVHRAEYEPEYERYGGRELIARSEEVFHRSSRVALRVCRARAGIRHGLVSGLEATAAACSLLAGDDSPTSRSGFLAAQRDMWLSWTREGGAAADSVEDARRQLADQARRQLASLGALGDALRAALKDGDPRWTEWTDPLERALRQWTAELGRRRAVRIFASHVHMTANRLGVGAGREAHLAQLLLGLLDTTEDGGRE
ncbi:thiopeptide-type bacteriocin biosynthesis protein [Streptomyces sp. PTM05]|uniref:Thiopeptide-type bacteriocin biosynthesis protein n=1 Tax=Streptantibioticus parmotrematis TaxID=2873249 RepID=A0ABS7QKH1_9ACTN|nr:thiopeptide-type bacteriocin biosynthesis protein [Streptantibioticus parmotrematis]MBY8883687.1 thiopeptide-type bacteriocin biosynthesis protein [Streptantibioticus parmotrematis]